MANVIKTVITYALDGSTREFNIPFEYLARKFVSVTLIGAERKTLTLNSDYRFASQTVISLNRAWGSTDGYTTVEFRRYTSATERLVDFTDGSILRAYDLNVAQVQTMHVAEEARDLTADTISVNNDGQLDARGRRIVNLADGQADGDAISVGQVKRMNENSWQARNESLQFRNEAEQFRNDTWNSEGRAWQYADYAHTYADGAKSSETSAADSAAAAKASAADALNYRNDGWQYQDWAKGYKEAAEASATTATAQADRATTEASKLGNMNALASAIDNVTDAGQVTWKGAQVSPGVYSTNGELTLVKGSSTMRFAIADSSFDLTPGGFTYIWLSDLSIKGVNEASFKDLYVTLGAHIGNAWLGPDGNITGPAWPGGSLAQEVATKATWDGLNGKLDVGVANSTLLTDVAHGAPLGHNLNNLQGTFEVPAGHSLVGWYNTTSDGNIRYTHWISRAIFKRTPGSGWIQCGNIS